VSPFVGRDHELDELGHAATSAAAGRGQIVGVVGDAGVGKSRLVWEFLHSSTLTGWRIVQGAAAPYASAPYAPIAQVVRALLGVPEHAPSDVIRYRVTARLQRL